MVGISAYGVYVPLHRLGPETVGWYGRNEKAVANTDEDAITMSVAAAINCLEGKDRSKIDGLYFASTTSPYREKQAAALIASAIDLRPEVLTSDFTNSLRAGTLALRAAVDTIKAGSARQILVTVSDLRIPQSHSEFETVFGDGGVAFLIGDTDIAVSIEDMYTISDEILDEWVADHETHPRGWESRFVYEKGYGRVFPQAVAGLMKKTGLSVSDLAKVAFYGFNARRHTDMAKKLGFDPKTQLQDGMFGTMGNTGTPFALMILSAALDEAKAGDKLLLGSYGDGADVFYLQAMEKIDEIKPRRNIKKYLESKRMLSDYVTQYANWRGLIDVTPAARRPQLEVPEPPVRLRREDKNIRFYGVKCKNCGYPQYPPTRICTRCQTKDQFEPYRFSDKRATLFTYSSDYLGSTLDPPLVGAMVNFEGGGRAMLQMVDKDVNQLELGMPLELTFRKLYTIEGIHNYYWCCTPLRIE